MSEPAISNQMRLALARLKQGPCLAYDIGCAVGGRSRATTARVESTAGGTEARRHVGSIGARIAGRLVTAKLAVGVRKKGLIVYAITHAGSGVRT